MKNNINNIHLSRSSSKRNTENETQNENLTTHSQCPLCFVLYPTIDIEVKIVTRLLSYLQYSRILDLWVHQKLHFILFQFNIFIIMLHFILL